MSSYCAILAALVALVLLCLHVSLIENLLLLYAGLI